MNIPTSIFKAYDIRGIVETELTPEIVKLIGKAVGSESIEKGEKFSHENIKCLRPAIGIPPSYFSKILGKKAKKNLKLDHPIRLNDF